MLGTALSVSLDSFYHLYSQFASQNNLIFWIRDLSYNKQLFLSPQFEMHYECSSEVLYKDPNSWWDFLLPEDKNNISTVVNSRSKDTLNPNINDTILFRFKNIKGDIKYIRDISMKIYNEKSQPIAIAGIGENLKPETWHHLTVEHGNKSTDTPIGSNINIAKILEEENNKLYNYNNKIKIENNFVINGISVSLSRREMHVLEHLNQGRTAKETAKLIHLSPRTVEFYLESLKQKTGCKTKIELLSKLSLFV